MKHIDKRSKARFCVSFPRPFEFPRLPFLFAAPCCPGDFRAAFMSSDTVRVTWAPVRGADLYETRAAGGSGVVLCKDTATACTLSALQCNTPYNITVYSVSEARGSNTSCAPQYVATGSVITHFPLAEELIIRHHSDSWMGNITGVLSYCLTLLLSLLIKIKKKQKPDNSKTESL